MEGKTAVGALVVCAVIQLDTISCESRSLIPGSPSLLVWLVLCRDKTSIED